MKNRRVDHAVILAGTTTGMDQFGFWLLGAMT